MRRQPTHAVLWLLLCVCPSEHLIAQIAFTPRHPKTALGARAAVVQRVENVETKIVVELLAYSGRPNPQAEVEAALEPELVRRLNVLAPLGHTFRTSDVPGYRGARVLLTSSSFLQEVEVCSGAVRVHEPGGRIRDLVDADRAFERWLLTRLETRLATAHQPLVQEILRQLSGATHHVAGDENKMADTSNRSQSIVGTWTKTTTEPCADKYPATITFSTGTYRGTRGPGQGMVWWDAGIYRIEAPKTLVVGTATDELVTYQLDLRGDRFEVTDAEGCRVAYRRG